jgi:hypothetical protein
MKRMLGVLLFFLWLPWIPQTIFKTHPMCLPKISKLGGFHGRVVSMDWFSRENLPESPMIFMGKSTVSGLDFPNKTNPLIVR